MKSKVLIIIFTSVLVLGFVFVFGLTSLTYKNEYNNGNSQQTDNQQEGQNKDDTNQNNNTNVNTKDETYTVTLNHQGGTSLYSDITVSYNRPMPSYISSPMRLYYTFGGYYSQPNGKGIAYYSANMTSLHDWDKESDGTLYAYWISDYKTISVNSSNYSQYFTVNKTCQITGSGYNGTYPCIYTYKVVLKQSATLGPNTSVRFTFTDGTTGTILTFSSTSAAFGATATSNKFNFYNPSTQTVTAIPSSVSGTLYIQK